MPKANVDEYKYDKGFDDGYRAGYLDGKNYQKVGRWERDFKRWGDNELRCSYCGAVLEDEVRKYIYAFYCYHCGANMELSDFSSFTRKD